VGKTTAIRELSRLLADECQQRVVVVVSSPLASCLFVLFNLSSSWMCTCCKLRGAAPVAVWELMNTQGERCGCGLHYCAFIAVPLWQLSA